MKRAIFGVRNCPFILATDCYPYCIKIQKSFVTKKQKKSKLSVIITIANCFKFLYTKK